MTRGLEHKPGEPASEAGEYHELNVFGSVTGRRVRARRGDALPLSPRGFAWRLSERSGDDHEDRD